MFATTFPTVNATAPITGGRLSSLILPCIPTSTVVGDVVEVQFGDGFDIYHKPRSEHENTILRAVVVKEVHLADYGTMHYHCIARRKSDGELIVIRDAFLHKNGDRYYSTNFRKKLSYMLGDSSPAEWRQETEAAMREFGPLIAAL